LKQRLSAKPAEYKQLLHIGERPSGANATISMSKDPRIPSIHTINLPSPGDYYHAA
jgi:hypothetical protein